ncbi:MAG: phosphodiester glycosidase family protein [Anaerolineae bacterium]|nr:phosphodiester glycosidase family protein [Anaerolineae bacterium]
MPKRVKRLLIALVLLTLIVSPPFVVVRLLRPPRTDRTAELFPGVSYVRQARSTPRPLMIHIVEVDVRTQGISFLVTPGDSSKGLEVTARTTSEFLEEFGLQIAVNGSFSVPFRAGTFLWDYYPHSGEPVDVTGLAISNGETYSGYDEWPVICITAERAEISQSDCPEGTLQALAGSQILVEDGESVVEQGAGGLHPRTAVAVDEEGGTLWLIVVDGRQCGYSEGVTLEELADIAVKLGGDRALNLDGGGSSTLVIADGGGTSVLNAPIHTRVPMRQRPVANHLGVYAQPIEE